MRRTRLGPDEIALALRLAQAGTPPAEIDRRLALEDDAPARVPVHEVGLPAIQAIARDSFGSGARIAAVEPLGPRKRHGLQQRGGFTGNLIYRVALDQPRLECVFRFNRGLREDVFDQEVENYAAVTQATGVRIPRVFRVDRSQRHVPTAYMVLEFLHGESWGYLAHPANPETSSEEKHAIRAAVGGFFGRLHGLERAAADPDEEMRQILWGLFCLKGAAEAGDIELDRARLERCLRAVEAESCLRTDRLAFCFSDGEIFFARAAGRWELSFVCDLEWLGYRDRYSDLVPNLIPSGALWELDEPLLYAGDPSREPFFHGYLAEREIDVPRLLRLPPYHQLCLWGHAIGNETPSEVRAWLRRSKGPLIRKLVELLAARAPE